MPIEIKELHIKVKIEENQELLLPPKMVSNVQLDVLKSDIIRECTAKVLETLKQREER